MAEEGAGRPVGLVLLAANRRRGVTPDFRTGRTRWTRLDDVPLDVREKVG